jgi:D-arabinose 1-dehydrogenase-like Zn-dependent alcohol dehydrogenase
VLIDVLYCGVCHSDVHQARDEWGGAIFPMVSGHEIVGTVAQVGSALTRWKVGDTVGVGVFVDSCRRCEACRAAEEHYCERGMCLTYNGHEQDGKTPTYCAGITTYSPLRHFGVTVGDRIAVVGLGGLGHVAVKLAKPMDPTPLSAAALIDARRRLAGSSIGGIRKTQEMLDFCAAHGVVADVEVIPIQQISEAYDRTVRSDVRYRFVIDIASLKGPSGGA